MRSVIMFILRFAFLALGVLASILMWSCASKTFTTSKEVYDTTYVEYRDRLVTYRVPADSAKLVPIRIECDPVTNKPKPVMGKKKSGRATVTAGVNASGDLFARSDCDELKGEINAQDKIIRQLRRELEQRTKTEYRVPLIHKVALWYMIITILLGAGYLVLKLKFL